MMSHELRTPMNGVLGMLQLLETTEQTREQAEYTALATESTEHLLKVINDILDFSRIERGALELECIASTCWNWCKAPPWCSSTAPSNADWRWNCRSRPAWRISRSAAIRRGSDRSW